MAKKNRDTTKPTTKAAIPIQVPVDGKDAPTTSGIVGEPRSPMTPQAATAPFLVRQSTVDWCLTVLPDMAWRIEELKKNGEIVVIDEVKKNANRNSPSLKSEQRTPRQQVMVCQRCNRAIPTDANCCPYCAHPVSIPAIAAKAPKKVSRKASAAGDPATRTQGVSAGMTPQAAPALLVATPTAYARALEIAPDLEPVWIKMIQEGMIVIVEQKGDQKENRQ